MTQPYRLSQINRFSQSEFVEALGAVFEGTPAIAAQAWQQRPFASIEDLHQAMVQSMAQLSDQEALGLMCAHPDLGSRLHMAPASVQEQARAGLDQLTPQEYQQFLQLNQSYRQRFGFPFIMAIKGQSKQAIQAAFHRRLGHSPAQEKEQALREVAKIARFRLTALVQP